MSRAAEGRKLLTGIMPAQRIEVKLTGALLRRLRAHMDRLEATEVGLAYEEGESDEDSLRCALEALIDGGLAEAELSHGLVADFLTGDLRPYGYPLKLRMKLAWRMLRHGR